MTTRKFSFRPVRFVDAGDGRQLVVPAGTERPKAIGVYLEDREELPIHLFDLSPDRIRLARWIVQTLNDHQENIPDARVCCTDMDPVGLDHDDQEPIDHRDVFECRRCSRTEFGDWSPCDCIRREPEEHTDKLNDRLEQGR